MTTNKVCGKGKCKFTDEFCASGDCPYDTDNVAQRNSQDLTEQYKTRTLPNNFYYFDNGKTQYIVEYHNIKGFEGLEGVKVLAEVPSYEEWKKLKSHNEKATIKLGEKIIENDKLKELLKECKETIETSVWGNCSELTDQIDEVLK